MELDADWLLSVGTAIGDLHDDLALDAIDFNHLAPRTEPAFFRRRPIFAVVLAGQPVGELQVAVGVTEERPVFSIGRLLLRPEAQGRGIARAIQAHLDRRLPAFGFDRISLDASGAGSFVWARLGYDFDLEAYRRLPRFRADSDTDLPARIRAELLAVPAPHDWKISTDCGGGTVPPAAPDSAARMLFELGRLGGRDAAIVSDLRSRLDGTGKTQLNTAREIASFGCDTHVDGLPEGSWLGRELMIRTRWSGVRRLPG